MAETVFGPSKTDQLIFTDFSQKFLTNLTIQHVAGVIVVTEQERQIEGVDFWYEVAQWTRGRDHHIHRTDLETFDHVALTAQLARRRLRAGEFTARKLGQSVDKCLRANAVVRRFGQGMADDDIALGVGGGCGQCGDRARESKNSMFHFGSSQGD